MNNSSIPALPVKKVTLNYLSADGIVSEWMKEYRRYLLDGDPNIVHPKAKVALVLEIAKALDMREKPAKVRTKGTPDAKAG